jgi:two-component system sensor histidine kinase FlrB
MGAMVFQSTHRFTNAIQRLRFRRDRILEASDDIARGNAIGELAESIETGTELVERLMRLARGILRPAYAPQQLCGLIRQGVLEHTGRDARQIEVSVMVPEDLIVVADQGQVVEAFRNIIDNAYEAMPSGGALTIAASHTDDGRRAITVFKDTGSGMTEEEKQAALRGFFSTKGHRGVGLLLASVLIGAQGGTIDIQSTKGVGTKVSVMLPMF